MTRMTRGAGVIMSGDEDEWAGQMENVITHYKVT